MHALVYINPFGVCCVFLGGGIVRNAVISVSMLFFTGHAIEVFQFAYFYFYSVSNSI